MVFHHCDLEHFIKIFRYYKNNTDVLFKLRLNDLLRILYNNTVSTIKKKIKDSNNKIFLAVDIWNYNIKIFFRIIGYFIDKQFDY